MREWAGRHRWWLAALVGISVSGGAWAVWEKGRQEREVIGEGRPLRVVYNENPPFYSSGADGRAHGVSVDLFNEAARRRGFRLDWVKMRRDPDVYLRTRQADLVLMAVVTPERVSEFHLTDPWMPIEGLLVWRQADGAGIPKLDGEKLGLPGFRLFESLARQHFPKAIAVRRTSRPEVLEMVCRGEIRAALLDSRTMATILLNRPQACANVAFGLDMLEGSATSLAIMSRTDSAWAAEGLRAELSKLSADGTMKRIYSAHGVGYSPEVRLTDELAETARRNRMLRWLLYSAGGLLLVIAVLAIHLRRALAAADQASQAKSNFLANMSHEIRTPMNGVIGLAEVLMREQLPESQRQMAESIRQCGRNLLEILNDVLDHSKLEAGKLELESAAFELRAPIRTVTDALRVVAEGKGLKLQVDVDSSTPEWVMGDSLRVSQILFNLIGNAIKFTEHGWVELWVRPTGPGRLRMDITDTGIGIAPEKLARLFEPFSQADRGTTRRFGGTGLGLSIVKRLADRMGGEVGVESRLGHGSRFWFEAEFPSCAAPAKTECALTSNLGPSLRLLFADDNAINRKVVASLLGKMGHEVDLVSDGLQAVEAFAGRRDTPVSYDALFLDCHMPVEDGFSAAQRIREIEAREGRPRIPIIALTALAFDEDRVRSREAGMDAHLVKPVRMEDLDLVIRALVHREQAAVGSGHATRTA